MTPEQLGEFKTPSKEELLSYTEEVRKDTAALIDALTPERIDDEMETAFGRSMSVGEIFSHLFCEMNQHAGQISYLRGYIRGYQGRRV